MTSQLPPPPPGYPPVQIVELDRPFITAWKVGLGFWAAGVTVTAAGAIVTAITFAVIIGGLGALLAGAS